MEYTYCLTNVTDPKTCHTFPSPLGERPLRYAKNCPLGSAASLCEELSARLCRFACEELSTVNCQLSIIQNGLLTVLNINAFGCGLSIELPTIKGVPLFALNL